MMRKLLKFCSCSCCNKIFIPFPNMPKGLWMKTDRCVMLRKCPSCGANIGEPCWANGVGKKKVRYQSGTHYKRHIEGN